MVALVITIIVLLMLAGVTIVTLFGESGIITKAQKAADETDTRVEAETNKMDDIESLFRGWEPGGKDEKGVTIFKKGKTTVKIGDYINYKCASEGGANRSYTSYAYGKENNDHNGRTSGYSSDQTFKASEYTGKWRVLGVNEKGELEIISDTEVPLKVGNNSTTDYYLGRNFGGSYVNQGRAAYKYGVEELNEISKIYGYGKNATGARSINVEDVNTVTGYNPKRERNIDNNPNRKGSISEYGNIVTYKWQGGTGPECSGTNGTTWKITTSSYENSGFTWYDEETKEWKNSPYIPTASDIPIAKLEMTGYYYFPTTLGDWDKYPNIGIKEDSREYNLLFGKTYILASKYTGLEDFGYFCVSDNQVCSWGLSSSYRYGSRIQGGVRPVVSLESNIQLEPETIENEDKDIVTWNIK